MNKAFFVTIFISIVCFSTLFAQNAIYNVEFIPNELLENAGSVIRNSEITFSVKSKSKAELTRKYAITIFHESHLKNATFREFYDRFSKIHSIRITIYNKNGTEIKSIPKSEILDLTGFTDNALFADIRQKVWDPDYREYPFTVEYTYQVSFNGLLSFPTYALLTDYDVSCVKGKFVVNLPGGENLRYITENTDVEPSLTHVGSGVEYQWTFGNVKAIRNEDYDEGLMEMTPIVRIAPNDFEMGGFEGKCNTWEEFGNWIYSLSTDRDILPEKTIAELKELTKNAANNTEKIRLVYEYMQSKTRYVNVVVGIGGWQPIAATEVDNNGFGDCKGLTNYTQSLLKAVDIESVYTLIKAGDHARDILSDFPSNQFNHAILCAPNSGDTIWLECTSQRNPFGYLGSFTEGRTALLIKKDKSKLVRTPALTINENLRIRNAEIRIDGQGQASAIIENKYQGSYFDNMRGTYYLEGKRRMDQVRNNIHIKHFTLDDQNYEIMEHASDLPVFIEKYKITTNQYVKKMGEKLIFDINFFNTDVDVPSPINNQESDIQLLHSYTKVDSLTFNIPIGYEVKSIPSNDSLISDFGDYYTNFKLEGNTLHYIRKELVKEGKFSSSRYNDLRLYLKEINADDKRKVMVMPIE
jgi:hypothetical protein